jgi:hypothetical protein
LQIELVYLPDLDLNASIREGWGGERGKKRREKT